MKKSILAFTFILSVSLFAIASSSGDTLYAKCKGCHGTDGTKAAMGVSPILKGQSEDAIESKLKGYAAGTYGGAKKSTMASQASKLSEHDISELAEYISKF